MANRSIQDNTMCWELVELQKMRLFDGVRHTLSRGVLACYPTSRSRDEIYLLVLDVR